MTDGRSAWKAIVMAVALAVAAWAPPATAGVEDDRAAVLRTGEAIRKAFADDDLAAIMAFHHPRVIKALAPDRYLDGREAVRADLAGTLGAFRLMFSDYRLESLLIEGDTAVEESVFAIRGVPKAGGEGFVFRGRSMVVYARSKDAPNGWASIREIVQPFP